MSQVVILGWDALDGALIKQYGLEAAFGRSESIDTITNPIIEEPHTLEVWPSMITGHPPATHGVRAPVDDGERIDWANESLNVAARLADGIVPDGLQTAIGAWLLDNGADIQRYDAAHYDAEGIGTVFDDVDARPISIPNYETAYDRQHGLDPFRDDVWSAILPDRQHVGDEELAVGIDTIWSTLSTAAADRVGHTIAAIERGHSVTWTWFGLLDTIGHIAPLVEAPLEERGYQLAARLTQAVRDAAPDDAVVVCVSDHGLQCGSHTEYATLATDHAGAHEHIDHVCQVADWVREASGDADGRVAGYSGDVGELREDLEALGYV